MPASRIRALARDSRRAIAAGLTQNAEAMRRRVEPQHRLQHQRRADRRVDRWMGADEQQLQPLVAEPGGSAKRASASSATASRVGAAAWRTCRRRAASISRRRAAVSSQASGFPGMPVARPLAQSGAERIGQRVLRGGDVARAGREEGEQPAVGLARRPSTASWRWRSRRLRLLPTSCASFDDPPAAGPAVPRRRRRDRPDSGPPISAPHPCRERR